MAPSVSQTFLKAEAATSKPGGRKSAAVSEGGRCDVSAETARAIQSEIHDGGSMYPS